MIQGNIFKKKYCEFAASEQQWHNEKFIADFSFDFYYENR
jgi:hypothetical protein